MIGKIILIALAALLVLPGLLLAVLLFADAIDEAITDWRNERKKL